MWPPPGCALVSPVPTEGLPEWISLARLLGHIGHTGSNPVFLGGGPSEDRLGADSHSAGKEGEWTQLRHPGGTAGSGPGDLGVNPGSAGH